MNAICFLPGEFWWGGRCIDGTKMPLGADTACTADLRCMTPNQGMPLPPDNRDTEAYCRLGSEYRMETELESPLAAGR